MGKGSDYFCYWIKKLIIISMFRLGYADYLLKDQN